MKKQIIIAALVLGAFVLGTSNVLAQEAEATGKSVSPETTASIEIGELLSIETSGGDINFSYTEAEHYNEDQTKGGGAIKVTSTSKFDISVKAKEATFYLDGIPGTIPVGILEIKERTGGDMGGDFTPNFKLSSNDGENLVINADKGINKQINIDYFISSDDAKTYLFGKKAGTYTQTITYTATAR